MATIEETIYKLLKDSQQIHAICADRVYPNEVPQNSTYPLVCYMASKTEKASTPSGKPVHTRMQIWSYGKTYSAAKALAIAISGVLDRYRNFPTVQGIFEIADDDSPYISENEDRTLFGVRTDYNIVHTL